LFVFALILCDPFFNKKKKKRSGEGLTLVGWSRSEKPINNVTITRNKTKSNTISKELHGLGLKPMIVLKICKAPYGNSPCGSQFLEAQPFIQTTLYSNKALAFGSEKHMDSYYLFITPIHK
jgi:hypothetical protein